MTIDINKVNQYRFHSLSEVDLEDGDILQTQDDVTQDAQRQTDRCGQTYGIFKLIAYTQPSPPLAMVVPVI